jgi:hypothetical protein
MYKTLLLAFLVILLSACAAAPPQPSLPPIHTVAQPTFTPSPLLTQTSAPTVSTPITNRPTRVVQMGDYAYLSEEDRIDQSEAIFVGKVLRTAAPRWNQNSGEPWKINDRSTDPNQPAALLYQTLEVEVIQPVVDTLGIGSRITITFLGSVPLYGANPGVPIQTGDRGIFLIRRNEIAWREGGKKSVFYFVGDPAQSCLIQASIGLFIFPADPGKMGQSLDEWLRKIAERQGIRVQPK